MLPCGVCIDVTYLSFLQYGNKIHRFSSFASMRESGAKYCTCCCNTSRIYLRDLCSKLPCCLTVSACYGALCRPNFLPRKHARPHFEYRLSFFCYLLPHLLNSFVLLHELRGPLWPMSSCLQSFSVVSLCFRKKARLLSGELVYTDKIDMPAFKDRAVLIHVKFRSNPQHLFLSSGLVSADLEEIC